MFRFCAAPAGIAPRDMSLINSGTIGAPLNFLCVMEERGEEAQLQLADELIGIGVTAEMAENLEKLFRLSGVNNRSTSMVLGPTVRGRVGEELYNSLTARWTFLKAAEYFKLTRKASVAGAGKAVSAAQQTVKICKLCAKPAAARNYGFCHECRAPAKK
jgi:hypothetical protein